MANENAAEALAAWETSSQYWNKHQTLIEQMFTALSGALIHDAGICSGQRVLDIGGGGGEPSLTVAPLVGSSGLVAYTDPAAGMVRSASEEATRRGIGNIQFHQCPAEHLPFPDASFDAAVGRLSVMFIPEIANGLAEILRVLKPAGSVSFVVWGAREANPFFTTVSTVLDRFVPAEPEADDAPGPFRFADAGRLAAALHAAGAVAVAERVLDFNIEAPITVERFWELRTEMSDSFRKKLARLVPDQVAAIKYTVQKTVSAYFKTGAMSFPAQVIVVTGRKPGE